MRKVSAKIRLIHTEQMSLYNFFMLRKERDPNAGVFQQNLGNFQEQRWLFLKTCNILRNKKLSRA